MLPANVVVMLYFRSKADPKDYAFLFVEFEDVEFHNLAEPLLL